MSAINNYHSLLLSKNMSITTEGYLICHNVPICRSGSQEYLGSELEGMPGYETSWNLDSMKKYRVQRPANEVLHPDTIKSFEGKSVVDTHPTSEGNIVHIDNERYLNCGHIQNVKEGEKLGDEVTLQGDLWIKDPMLREKVRPQNDPNSPNAVRDVSCGYTMKLKRMGDGSLVMYHIRGNHVAVVEKGRAGPGIAIRDSAPPEIKPKRSKTNMSLKDLIFGTGLKAVLADATPEQLVEFNKEFGGTRSITPETTPIPTTKPAVDGPNPHAIAAHHCLDRCLAARKDPKKMGLDAFGEPVPFKDLFIELGRYIGDEALADKYRYAYQNDAEPKKEPAMDAVADKMEDMVDADPPKEEPKKEVTKDEDYSEPSAMSDETINNLGMSELHALGDATSKQLKAIRPIVASMISIRKSERTPDQQMIIDSYNEAVRTYNKARTSPAYKTLAKPKEAPPEVNGTFVSVTVDSNPNEDVLKFYEGVPFLVGKQRHEEYLMKKGNK